MHGLKEGAQLKDCLGSNPSAEATPEGLAVVAVTQRLTVQRGPVRTRGIC